MKLNVFPAALRERAQFTIVDEFASYTDTQLWTKSVTGGGTVAFAAGSNGGGAIAITTGATLNDGGRLTLTNACIKLGKGQPFYAESILQYTETSTNNAMIAFGLSSVVTSSLLTDSTGVPLNNFTGMLIYKQVGDTYWRCVSSNGTTQTLTQSALSSQPATTTDFQLLRIEGRDVDGSNFEITYFLNDNPLTDYTYHRPIKHTVAIASASAMKLIAMAKAGTTASEVLTVDQVIFLQRRATPAAVAW